jgi:hypothetical protein
MRQILFHLGILLLEFVRVQVYDFSLELVLPVDQAWHFDLGALVAAWVWDDFD